MATHLSGKRIFNLLACLALLVVCLPTQGLAEDKLFSAGGLQYRVLTEDSQSGTYTAELANNQGYAGHSLSVPSTTDYGGHTYSIITVGEAAFRDANLTGTLTLPDSVTFIKKDAFRGTGITQLNLPDNEGVNIGPHAFSGTQLTGELNIPASVFYIQQYAFMDCAKITSLKLNKHSTKTGYLTIGIEAFSRTGLQGTLVIPDSVGTIGGYAFQNLTGLTQLELPQTGLQKILSGAFARTGLTGTVTIPPSVIEIGSFSFQGVQGLTGLALPEAGLKIIGHSAFAGTSLQGTLTLPNTVKTIGNNAFLDCKDLTGTLIIPGSVETIEAGAFRRCTGLEAVVFAGGQAPVIEAGAFESVSASAYVPDSGTGYSQQPGLPPSRLYSTQTARITSLRIGASAGLVDEASKTITLQLPYGSNLANQRPSIGFLGSRISPASGVAQDFSRPVLYTVQPITGSAVVYRVVVTASSQPPAVATAGVNVNPTTLQLETGATYTLQAAVTPAGAADKRLEWTTGNAAIATVGANGTVTAHSAGSTTITAKTVSGGYTATCAVTVLAKQQPIQTTHMGWAQVEGKRWVYYDKAGNRLTGWQKIDGCWYYFNGSGLMQTGWQKLRGKWYYLKSGGAMATGWQKVGGTWYYFKAGGVMATGWQKVGGSWYYLKSSGVMVTGSCKIGSRISRFVSNGKWLGY